MKKPHKSHGHRPMQDIAAQQAHGHMLQQALTAQAAQQAGPGNAVGIPQQAPPLGGAPGMGAPGMKKGGLAKC